MMTEKELNLKWEKYKQEQKVLDKINKEKSLNELKLNLAVTNMLYEISHKHNVKKIEDFTCPHFRKLAELVGWEYVENDV